MTQIRLYFDEDAMDMVLVTALRNRGVDVRTVNEQQTTGDSDEEQLTLATKEERVLFSHNIADFCRLHSIFMMENRTHGGIILIDQQRYSTGDILGGLMNLIETVSAEEVRNQLFFLGGYIRAVQRN